MTYLLTQDKLYLYVPFSQKEEAKEHGAKYDPVIVLKFYEIKNTGNDLIRGQQIWALNCLIFSNL